MGQTVTYTWTITNSGPSTAATARLNGQVPEGATWVAFGTISPGVGCVGPGEDSRQLLCQLGDLAPGATVSVSAQLSYAAVGTYTDAFAATTVTPDDNPDNNAASATVTVIRPVADLVLTESASPNPAGLGEPVTYTWTITNNGPSTAATARLNGQVPEGATWVRFGTISPGVGCVGPGGGSRQLLCQLRNLAPGATRTVSVVLSYASVGTYTDAFSATTFSDDPNPANSTSSVSVVVV